MNENTPTPAEIIPEVTPESTPAPLQQENFLAGIVGAFLFSLAGGIIWFILYQIGFLAAISGIIGVVCAIKGYAVFGKAESIKGVIASTVIAFLVIVIAWYACLSYDVYLAYADLFETGDIDFKLNFFEAFQNAYLFLTEPDVGIYYWKDLVIGLLFCIGGCIAPVKNAITAAKQSKKA